MNPDLQLILLALAGLAVATVLVLLSFGEIGPTWWKKLMQRYQRWNFRDAAPLFPVDPYKIPNTSGRSPDDLPPFKERLKNQSHQYAIAILLGLITFAVLYLWASYRY